MDGEIDFLVLSPALGFMVLEDKGGVIKYVDGKGTQNNRELMFSPYAQAKKYKYAVLDYLKKKVGKRVRIPVNYAVVSPCVTA